MTTVLQLENTGKPHGIWYNVLGTRRDTSPIAMVFASYFGTYFSLTP
jgi:hypothetical protein